MTANALTRRFSPILWLLLLVAIAAFLFTPSDAWRSPFTTDDGLLAFMGYSHKEQGPVRITILESIGTHDEVVAALIHSFGGQKDAELTLFLDRQRYHMADIVRNFTLEAPIVSLNKSTAFAPAVRDLPAPHVLVSTTCELDLEADRVVMPLRDLLANSTTHFFCLIHHADQWTNGRHVDVVREWVEAERVDFIALSQHTSNFFLHNTVPQWHTNKTVTTRVFPPVFPVDLPDPDEASTAAGEISLAMQGDYSSSRRDYKGMFDHLGDVVRKVNESSAAANKKETLSLHLIGHGERPEVPEAVASHVKFDESLSYPDFYALISRAFAILPAFAEDSYFDRKASSSVPASLIAGTPIVASEELLKAYTYLPREVTWLSNPGEGEMEVMKRVIENRAEYMQKREAVRAVRAHLLLENRVNVKEWIAEALDKANA